MMRNLQHNKISDNAASSVQKQRLESIKELEKNGSPGLVGNIIQAFMQSSIDLLQPITQFSLSLQETELTTLLETEQEALLYAVHTLKSSAGNVGAECLADLCAEVEECVKNQQITQLPQLCNLIGQECNLVKDGLNHWFASS